MGSHWMQFQSSLNSTAKTIDKGADFLVIPDQRNTHYDVRYGEKRKTIDLSVAEQILADPSKLADFVREFLG